MYNKLFAKILDSSIWLQSTTTRIVWLTLIAAMDEDGFAQFAAVGNLAHRARVTIEEAELAVAALEGPDPESSDSSNEGRRIERVPGGWLILNAEKHRALVTKAIIQTQTRERVRRHREKKRTCNAPVTPSISGSVSEVPVPFDAEPAVAGSGETEASKDEDKAVAAFLKRFCDLYAEYRAGAKYLVKPKKDVPNVRRLLKQYGHERLVELARGMLTTDEPWIIGTDWGLGILSIKANWLNARLSEYEQQQRHSRGSAAGDR